MRIVSKSKSDAIKSKSAAINIVNLAKRSKCLKLSNAWVPQTYYMITMVGKTIKAEHAITEANHVETRKGDLKSRNLGECVVAIVNSRTQFMAR